MRRAKAIEHLRTVIDTCERDQMFHGDSLLVVELWATGSILEPGDLPGGVEVVLVVALPPDQLPWGVTPPVLRAFIKGHRLDTKPIVVHARPAGRPVCTRGLPRAARLWTTDGTDRGQLDALTDPESHGLQVSSLEDVDRPTAIGRPPSADSSSSTPRPTTGTGTGAGNTAAAARPPSSFSGRHCAATSNSPATST